MCLSASWPSVLLPLMLFPLLLLIFSQAVRKSMVISLSQFTQNCPGFKTNTPTSQESSESQANQDSRSLSASPGFKRVLCTTWPAILFPEVLPPHRIFSLFFSTLILLTLLLGKHQPGVDKPDPKTWKANFRCAMNSLPDIEEVKDKSIKKGNNAFRVYRMLPLSERPSKKGR